MVTRGEVKLDIIKHLNSVSCEPSLEFKEFIDVDGLGLSILRQMGIKETFVGTPIKQFDRLFQFRIKYESSDVASTLQDTGVIKEKDLDKFLELCQKHKYAIGIIAYVQPRRALNPYMKEMVLRGKLENFIFLQEQSRFFSGQPILDTYKTLRDARSKSPKHYEKYLSAIIATNMFSASFRKMMRDLRGLSSKIKIRT